MKKPSTPLPPPLPASWVPLRGPSGRLHGYFNPQTLTIELKRKGEQPERISLGDLLKR